MRYLVCLAALVLLASDALGGPILQRLKARRQALAPVPLLNRPLLPARVAVRPPAYLYSPGVYLPVPTQGPCPGGVCPVPQKSAVPAKLPE